jgi:hypothetical protein
VPSHSQNLPRTGRRLIVHPPIMQVSKLVSAAEHTAHRQHAQPKFRQGQGNSLPAAGVGGCTAGVCAGLRVVAVALGVVDLSGRGSIAGRTDCCVGESERHTSASFFADCPDTPWLRAGLLIGE